MRKVRVFVQTCLTVTLVAGSTAVLADAARYATYAQKLDSGQITPLGAERAGNAVGTLPKWHCNQDGKYTVPVGIDVKPSEVDTHSYPAMKPPFANEKPRFVITAKNYKKYKDHLTPGTVMLLERYSDEFRMPVYPTHRTACFSKYVYKQTALNVKKAKLVDNGTGIVNSYMSVPFPLPKNGNEAVWNTLLNPNPFLDDVYRRSFAIFASGQRYTELTHLKVFSYNTDWKLGRNDYLSPQKDRTLQAGTWIGTLEPGRERGTGHISRSYLRPVAHRIQAWGYKPGTRRVRRQPFYGYDTPTGAGGLHGIDDGRGFNGSPGRFRWKLAGTKEIYVPYNNYKMDHEPTSYDQILGKHVINAKYTRWELHRVRVVIGTLKPGKRHWYEKRVLYLDEDSGHALMADNYDHHEQLWRTTQQNYVWTPIWDGLYARWAVYYDFEARAYSVDKLLNELPKSKLPRLAYKQMPLDYWSPATLRRQSFR